MEAGLSPDGRQVAYRWLDDKGKGWVRFVDTVTGEATPATRLPMYESPWPFGTWDPQGGQYASSCDRDLDCGKDGIVSVLDPATGKLLRQPRDVVDGDGEAVTLAYVDEGRSLLVSDNERIFIVDAETLRPRGDPFDILGNAGSCCITPIGDGSTAMVYEWVDGETMTWRVIDVTTGAVQPEGDVDMVTYTSVASPDGSTVAVAGKSGEIVTIDVSTGAEQGRSTSLGAAVRWLNYSDDGELLVSGAGDGGVSLWDATTLDLLGTVYPPHDGEAVPAGAQFIGDTHDVAIASYDGRVYRWETDVDRALDFACQMAGRTLTEEEWEEFLPEQPYESVCPQS